MEFSCKIVRKNEKSCISGAGLFSIASFVSFIINKCFKVEDITVYPQRIYCDCCRVSFVFWSCCTTCCVLRGTFHGQSFFVLQNRRLRNARRSAEFLLRSALLVLNSEALDKYFTQLIYQSQTGPGSGYFSQLQTALPVETLFTFLAGPANCPLQTVPQNQNVRGSSCWRRKRCCFSLSNRSLAAPTALVSLRN